MDPERREANVYDLVTRLVGHTLRRNNRLDNGNSYVPPKSDPRTVKRLRSRAYEILLNKSDKVYDRGTSACNWLWCRRLPERQHFCQVSYILQRMQEIPRSIPCWRCSSTPLYWDCPWDAYRRRRTWRIWWASCTVRRLTRRLRFIRSCDCWWSLGIFRPMPDQRWYLSHLDTVLWCISSRLLERLKADVVNLPCLGCISLRQNQSILAGGYCTDQRCANVSNISHGMLRPTREIWSHVGRPQDIHQSRCVGQFC